MKLIAFVGKPLAGKSEASRIAKEIGLTVINMGDVVREEVKRRGLEMKDKIVGKVATELREREGKDVIAKRCIEKVRRISGENVLVIDGIRSIYEVERFKKEFGEDFILISIKSPLEIRFERAKRRQREDDVSTIEELKERDRRELSWGMGEAIAMANLVIDNTGDIEEFRKKVKSILEEII
jgi:dephospho-CoA kinase